MDFVNNTHICIFDPLMKTPLPLLFFLSSLAIHGQVPLDTAAVKSQLAEIFAADQGVRKNADSANGKKYEV